MRVSLAEGLMSRVILMTNILSFEAEGRNWGAAAWDILRMPLCSRPASFI